MKGDEYSHPIAIQIFTYLPLPRTTLHPILAVETQVLKNWGFREPSYWKEQTNSRQRLVDFFQGKIFTTGVKCRQVNSYPNPFMKSQDPQFLTRDLT